MQPDVSILIPVYNVIAPADMLKPQYSSFKSLIISSYVFEFFMQMKDLGVIKSFADMRLDIGENGQYDMQIRAMDDLYLEMSKMGIEIDYPGKK